MRDLSIDIETYCEIDIGNCGSFRYIEDESFEIMLFAYSVDFGDPVCIDFTAGETIPMEILMGLFDPAVTKRAFNAGGFEWPALSKYFGLSREQSLEWLRQWRCDMVHSYYLSYAGGLDTVGKAVGIPQDKQKLTTGKALIRYFCQPCKPTKSNGGRTRNLPKHAPGKWALFKEYNVQDVVAENAIYEKIKGIEPPDWWWNQWYEDMEINSRGAKLDREFIEGAIYCNERSSDELMKEFKKLTGLDNPNSNVQLLEWLHSKGITIDNLQKATVENMLAEDSLSDDCRRALELRQLTSKTSTKKYYKMLDCISPNDDRVRGLTQYAGASRTNRWAGKLIQPQNLKRSYLEDLDTPRELIKRREYTGLKMFYGDVMDVTSQLARTSFVPYGNGVIVDADFTSVEAVVGGWISGQESVLEVFRTHCLLYESTASAMYGVPLEDCCKGGKLAHLRSKGKIAVLACIAEDELVLTDRGLVKIQDVTTDMKVWDGENWVPHDGVIYKGKKEVIEYEGLRATRDHLVWVDGEDKPMPFGAAAESGSHLVQSGYGWKAIRASKNHIAGKKIYKKLVWCLRTRRVPGVRKYSLGPSVELNTWNFKRLRQLRKEKKTSIVAGQKINCCQTKMREPERQKLSQVWRERDKIRVQFCDRSGTVPDGRIRTSGQSIRDGQDRYERELCKRESPVCHKKRKSSEQTDNRSIRVRSSILAIRSKRSNEKAVLWNVKRRNHRRRKKSSQGEKEKLARNSEKVRVYDIRNAGPYHRFTVSGKLVHNCSYGGGVGSLQAFDTKGEIPEDQKQTVVNLWRESNPEIVKAWYQIGDAMIDTIKTGSPHVILRGKSKTELVSSGGIRYLRLYLPSGRAIHYANPHITKDRWGRDSIGFYGMNQITRKWEPQETYGPRCYENLIQAVSRDLLANALSNLTSAGYEIMFHVHDEVVISTDEWNCPEEELEDVIRLMCKLPAWAEGLPLKADGWTASTFRKL